MSVVGSRYGDTNLYATGKGKGFTVICNDCGITLSKKDTYASFCVFCEQIAVFQCPKCKQESHVHTSPICTREVNYVLEDEKPLGQLRDAGRRE